MLLKNEILISESKEYMIGKILYSEGTDYAKKVKLIKLITEGQIDEVVQDTYYNEVLLEFNQLYTSENSLLNSLKGSYILSGYRNYISKLNICKKLKNRNNIRCKIIIDKEYIKELDNLKNKCNGGIECLKRIDKTIDKINKKINREKKSIQLSLEHDKIKKQEKIDKANTPKKSKRRSRKPK